MRRTSTATLDAATIAVVAMWHCPHCGTPQAETARCWVCRRSSTTCSTCRHFRRAVAAGIGYCGLDRSRRPLRGDEIRGCWQGLATAPAAAPELRPSPAAVRPRAFVPLDLVTGNGPIDPPSPAPDAGSVLPLLAEPPERATLFDLEA